MACAQTVVLLEGVRLMRERRMEEIKEYVLLKALGRGHEDDSKYLFEFSRRHTLYLDHVCRIYFKIIDENVRSQVITATLDRAERYSSTFVRNKSTNMTSPTRKVQAWLGGILKRVVADLRLSSNREVQLRPSEWNQIPDRPKRPHRVTQQTPFVLEALGKLPDDMKLVLQLYVNLLDLGLDRLEYGGVHSIAAIMELDVDVVRGLIYRAKKKVREYIENAEAEAQQQRLCPVRKTY